MCQEYQVNLDVATVLERMVSFHPAREGVPEGVYRVHMRFHWLVEYERNAVNPGEVRNKLMRLVRVAPDVPSLRVIFICETQTAAKTFEEVHKQLQEAHGVSFPSSNVDAREGDKRTPQGQCVDAREGDKGTPQGQCLEHGWEAGLADLARICDLEFVCRDFACTRIPGLVSGPETVASGALHTNARLLHINAQLWDHLTGWHSRVFGCGDSIRARVGGAIYTRGGPYS